MSTLANNERSSSWILLKKVDENYYIIYINILSIWNILILLAKLLRVFPVFSGEQFGTILSRRSRLSRTSRAPSRLIRPRTTPDRLRYREPEHTVKMFPSFIFWVRSKSSQKMLLNVSRSSPDLHPKRSPSPDFRDRGVTGQYSAIRRQMLASIKKAFLGRASA